MDNRFSNKPQSPAAQASEFFIEFRAGDATPAVRARFDKWLRSSPENVQAYLEVAAGWAKLPTGDPEGRIDLQVLLAAAAEGKGDNVVHLDFGRAAAVRPSPLRRTRFWTLIASLFVLITLAGTGTWLVIQGRHTYKTGIGEQRTLILADGSTVILNALTTVRVHMTRESREVILVQGQAYFHDTDDPHRPFIVRSGEGAVRAIGTAFDVNIKPDRMIVTVLSGRVAVARPNTEIGSIEPGELLRDLAAPALTPKVALVSAGEQINVLAQNTPTPKPIDVTAVTAWMRQRLVFDDTPLSEVAEQFNLYSKRRLVITDHSLRSIGVSGEYSASDPAALIGFLRSQPSLIVTTTHNEFLVRKR